MKLQPNEANVATDGFTLIEIMVAVSLFAIVAVIVSGALVTTSEVNRKAQAIKLAMDNVSFAMDSISRNLSNGMFFSCLVGVNVSNPYPNDDEINPATNCEGIAFRSKTLKNNNCNGENCENRRIVYRFNDSDDTIQIWQDTTNDTKTFVPITSPEVKIETAKFSVYHTENRPDLRALVTIRGSINDKTSTKFNLQTSVMARN
ncbi:MAG TPA: type II secretion system protein [Candidatus Paceibacterota bacterium]